MSDGSYEDRIAAQISQYAETIDMHALPESFHIWSNASIRPALEKVFGTASIDEAYALAYINALPAPQDQGYALSVGCGDGSVEIRVAELLVQKGYSNFHFRCVDVSPILLGNFRVALSQRGLEEHFELVETDINTLEIEGRYNMVMANHSLHHVLALEHVSMYIRDHLDENGVFATCDMIGRNGHMRWPESAAVVNALWPTLDARQKYHAQLGRYDETFNDHDCSTEGFEGVRAQDILALILKDFYPYRFVGAGGFVDMMVDRGYGHGYDVSDETVRLKVSMMANLNDILLDSGTLKPTWMMAYFTRDDRGEIFYRDRRAFNCVRSPDSDPGWTRFYR